MENFSGNTNVFFMKKFPMHYMKYFFRNYTKFIIQLSISSQPSQNSKTCTVDEYKERR